MSPPPQQKPPGIGRFTPSEHARWVQKHPKHEYKVSGPWEPDDFYKRYTPKWFADHGYYYAGRGGVYPHNWFEVWLTDAGKGAEIRVWRIDWERGPDPSTPPTDPPPKGPGEQLAATFPPFFNPNADHEKLFGPVVAERLGVDHAIGEGDMLRHMDGTVVLHLTGTTKSIVLRPVPNGKDTYILYWEDGRRDRLPYRIDSSSLPDPVKDATD